MTSVEDYRNWTPAAQQRALQLLQQKQNDTWRPFYCGNRECNGKPHGEWLWNHARSDQYPPSDLDWLTWVITSGRGAGKALDVDTPVPTPSGWTTMGALQDGDVVFGSDGRPCRVLRAWQPYVSEAHRVLFSDGAWLDADAEHQWSAWSRADRRAGRDRRVVTTAQLAATLRVAGERNWAMPVAAPLQLPEADLPVDPYVLGYWLGDGTSSTAEVTVGDADAAEVLALLAERGAPVSGPARRRDGAACATYPIGGKPPKRDAAGRMIGNDSLHSRLRGLGVLRNKHVPLRYLRASHHQRAALLAGLIDSDGYVSERGYVEITVTEEALAEGITALVRTLGHRVTVVKSPAMLHGVAVGLRWRVSFTARAGGGLLRRKQVARSGLGQPNRLVTRMVDSVVPVGPRVVRCITVDSSDSCYLAGEELLVTHNTRTGAELTHQMSEVTGRIALIGATGADVRDTMLEGDSGILTIARPDRRPKYEPSKRRLTWPNGCTALAFSAEEPDRLRGPQHGFAWCDEAAHFPMIDEVWSNLLFGLRVGKRPRILVTTTPVPRPWMKSLVADIRTRRTTASTYANLDNLAPTFAEQVIARYEGTRTGRQELYGEILEDVEGALWTMDMIETTRVPDAPLLERIVVGVDPSGSRTGDEIGIVVVGRDVDKHLYVLADYSGHYTPHGWARRVEEAVEFHDADIVVAERNFGGDMVEHTLRSVGFTGRVVTVHARKGKALRAEPLVGYYEQRKVHHCGIFTDLETEMVEWVPYDKLMASPNRIDALVYASVPLMERFAQAQIASPIDLPRTAAL